MSVGRHWRSRADRGFASLADTPAIIHTQEEHVVRIIEDLVDNALKYSAPPKT